MASLSLGRKIEIASNENKKFQMEIEIDFGKITNRNEKQEKKVNILVVRRGDKMINTRAQIDHTIWSC